MKKLLLIISFSSILFSSTTESLFWEEVKDSNDIEMLQLYKSKYPNGVFEIFANKKILELSGGKIKPTHHKGTFFRPGTYQCQNFKLYLKKNSSAYYYKNKNKIKGVWSSKGSGATLFFREDYKKVIFNIKQKYSTYSIYKNNRFYCKVTKIIH